VTPLGFGFGFGFGFGQRLQCTCSVFQTPCSQYMCLTSFGSAD
jgi:hypothetical protein